MKIFKQQKSSGLERYVSVWCDLTVNSNVLPINRAIDLLHTTHPDITLDFLLNKILRDHFNAGQPPVNYSDLALIKTDVFISLLSDRDIYQDDLYLEYSKYKNNFNRDCEPVILLHPAVFPDVHPRSEYLYQVDGMHRIISAAVSNINQLPAYVIIRRVDICKLLPATAKRNIHLTRSKCTWFPNYQQIREVGLNGQRTQTPRYPDIYDFSILEGNTVVDFGGNTGQAAIEAFFNNAKRVYSLDIQKHAVDTANKIFTTLGMTNCTSHTIDFNKSSFERDVESICSDTWDWCIFQAIYRTKEIKDIERNFKFIVENTRIGIVFEGNGEPTIDTDEFYRKIFKPYNFKKITHHGVCQQRPVYIIYK